MTQDDQSYVEEVDEASVSTWSYAVGKKGDAYFVVEVYSGGGYTEEIAPMGLSKEELIEDLKMMLNDLQQDDCCCVNLDD